MTRRMDDVAGDSCEVPWQSWPPPGHAPLAASKAGVWEQQLTSAQLARACRCGPGHLAFANPKDGGRRAVRQAAREVVRVLLLLLGLQLYSVQGAEGQPRATAPIFLIFAVGHCQRGLLVLRPGARGGAAGVIGA